MYPSPLAFFFPYWGLFGTRSRSARKRADARSYKVADGVERAAAASALAGQFQRALEIDPMRAADIARLWREAPR
jgi:hypothetical protein